MLRENWLNDAPVVTGVVVKAATLVDTEQRVHAVIGFSFRLPDSEMRAEAALVCTPEMLAAFRKQIVHEISVAETEVRNIERKSRRLIVTGPPPSEN